MTDLYDETVGGQLPPLHKVDFQALSASPDEDSFIRESFELLKEASVYVSFVAGLRAAPHSGLSRNHAIIVGHYARMVKLMRSLIRQVADGHGGDQQISINREFLDSVSTVMYLLRDDGDGSRFNSYVMDSLIAEREFLKTVRAQIADRGDITLPIEKRINRSIQETLQAAGVSEEDIPSRKTNGWPNAQTRVELLGPTAYAAYRTGSSAVHGSFSDLFKHHLEQVEGGFEIELRPSAFRPQPLLSMALLSLLTLSDYSTKHLGMPLAEPLAARGKLLAEMLMRTDDCHERFLNETRKQTTEDV